MSASVADLRLGPVADAIRRHRLIVILRRVEPRDRLLTIVEDLADAGARIFEVTFDAATAADDLVALRERLAGRADGPFVVGAGTLLTRDQLDAAHRAGADFGVTPLRDLDLLVAALDLGMPFIPGGMTPTELAAGWDAGATFVKLFPASAAGPQFIRELHGPLPEIEVIPTGGVDPGNAAAFLAAGAAAVGLGSALVRASADERRAILADLARPAAS